MKKSGTGTNPQGIAAPENAAIQGTVERPKRERATFHLPVDLMERVRNCVYWTPGLTMGELAEEGIRKTIDAYEKRNGGAFPSRKGELKGGRPMK